MPFWHTWTMLHLGRLTYLTYLLQRWPTILLTEQSQKRFALSNGVHELRFLLGHCEQDPTETIDDFADMLVLLINCALPWTGHQDMNGVGSGTVHVWHQEWTCSVQDTLLQSPLEDLHTTHKTAKRLDAALTTWKLLCSHLQMQQVNSLDGRRKEDETSLQKKSGCVQ